jgi:hypothetical protein
MAYDALSVGNNIQTFRDNLMSSSVGVEISKEIYSCTFRCLGHYGCLEASEFIYLATQHYIPGVPL